MRVLNLSPFTVAMKASARRPPQADLTIIAVGTYRVDDSDAGMRVVEDVTAVCYPSGDRFEDDDRARECVHPSDFADFKLNGEVVVTGSCHPPGGEPVRHCPVQIRFGAHTKSLRVVKDRTWIRGPGGLRPSAPDLFTKMPLQWSRAAGGPDVAANPVGVGAARPPNIERPEAPVTSPADRPAPVGLGPIHPDWSARRQHLGRRYDASWRRRRAPYFAEDFDHRYFRAAPDDQQIEGYFRGGDALGFDHLHPSRPRLDVRLPDRRVRGVFLDRGGRAYDVPLDLDTVHAQLDDDLIRLVWRGVVEVPVDDPDIVRALALVDQPRADDPISEAEVVSLLETYCADPGRVDARLTELRTAGSRATLPHDARTGNPLSDALKSHLGDAMPELQDGVLAAVAKARDAAPEDQRERLEAELAAAAAQADMDAPPPARRIRPGAPPDTRLRAQMRRVLDRTREARAELAAAPDLDAASRAKAEAAIAETEAVVHDPRLREIDPDYTPPVEPLSDDVPGPGADLAERDFSGQDLSERDLKGANLRGAVLTRTNLRRALLAGADLTGAVLYRADLREADLREANLTRVNAARADLRDARLDRSNLEEGFFEEADLSGVVLSRARGTFAVLTRARLVGAVADASQLPRSDLAEANLERANFAEADLTRASLMGVDASEATFNAATLTHAGLSGATLCGAVFTDAVAPHSVWRAADLSDAAMTGISLVDADLDRCVALRTTLVASRLRGSRWRRARLEGADLSGADLYEAVLDRAQVDRARFVAANLYGSSWLGAHGERADLRDAILTLSTLERAP
ncbi:MAG: DUF2169 domain-containing protein [Myxococcota bacterium]